MPMDETPGSVTDRQSAYIQDLASKKDLTDTRLSDEQREYLLAGDYSAMSKARASKAIGLLLQLNDKPVEVADVPQQLPMGATDPNEDSLPLHTSVTTTPISAADTPPVSNLVESAPDSSVPDAGYYFIVDPTDNVEKFFHVSKGKEGTRWAGYTFLSVRGGDFLYKIQSTEHKNAVFAEILKDPVTAMNEYGIRLGVCGCCGRTLTARDSRLRGIGPICAQQLMMRDAQATPDQIDMLHRLGLKK